MNTNEDVQIRRAHNRKVIIPYRILAFDLLFYYTISYLFLVNVKGFTTAVIVFTDSFYPFFKLILQIPATIMVQRIGKRNSLVIANTFVALYVLATIYAFNSFILILSNFFVAVAFVLKGMCESTILYDSLEPTNTVHEEFSKYESRSAAGYYFVDAITSLATGFLYAVNPYLPLYISLGKEILTIFVCLKLKEIPAETNELYEKVEKKLSAKEEAKLYIKNLGQAFKFIFKSKRLRSLILYNGLFASMLSLMVTLRRSLLNDTGVSSEYFGIIFTVLGIVAAVSSSYTFKIHMKYRNRTLTVLGLFFIGSIILSGLVVVLKLPLAIMYYIMLLMFSIQYIIKGPFYTLIKQYLNSFCDSDMRLKIYSANSFVEFITATVITFVCSQFLLHFDNAETTIIMGIIFGVLLILLLIYMLNRVGLKPEEYPKEDIDYKSYM